ncbi:type 1 glutamine amidotransferase [Candidatus Uhrbacteria bacterium]|jgi:GMP synthase (glutamine-hydrolysing)|nr:type 1 glutamine amidotransferase [Candidatus Uhrbacteria bacterium]
MLKQRDELKILLIQARDDAPTLSEERAEFVRFGKLNDDQLDAINLFDVPSFDPDIIDGYDALFVGGSSDADVLDLDKFPFITDAERLLVHCFEQNIPVLGSCYGFQLAVEALGGKVERSEEYAELYGSGVIEVISDAGNDPLFHDMPKTFRAVALHKDSATKLPDNVTLLARSEGCPYHAFKVNGKPFYVTQFHSEIDKKDFITRIRRYQARYVDTSEVLEGLVEDAVDMDDVNSIPWKFIDRIVMK